ncbi:MAG: hypothetical protein AAFW74_09750 [Pseudomonadota bacterium]
MKNPATTGSNTKVPAGRTRRARNAVYRTVMAGMSFLLAAAVQPAAAAQTCARIADQEATIDTWLEVARAKSALTVGMLTTAASQMYRAGHAETSAKFLADLPVGPASLWQLPDWSHAIRIVAAAQTGDLAKIENIISTVDDPKLAASLQKDVAVHALASFGQYATLASMFPQGKGVYTQNLRASTGINLLTSAGRYDDAIKLFEKHQFGYHRGSMLTPLARDLFRANKHKRLRELLKREWSRAVSFREVDLCLAGGLKGEKTSKSACLAADKKSRALRPLQLFDRHAYANCFLTKNKSRTPSCLAEITQRLKTSGKTFSDEVLNENPYSYEVKLAILKFRALLGEPQPSRLPAGTFSNVDKKDLDAISAQVVGLELNGETGSSAPLLRKTLAALKVNQDVSPTGAAAIFHASNPKTPKELMRYITYNRLLVHVAGIDDAGLQVWRQKMSETAPKRSVGMVTRALTFAQVQRGKSAPVFSALDADLAAGKESVFRDQDILMMAVLAQDNGFDTLSAELLQRAEQRHCSTEINMANAWSARASERFLKTLFQFREIQAGRLPKHSIQRFRQ